MARRVFHFPPCCPKAHIRLRYRARAVCACVPPGRQHMSDLYELRCKECGKAWGNSPRSFCEDCFSPLEVSFDYDTLKKRVRRDTLAGRSFNMWRYAEFLPLPEGYAPPSAVGGTPLVASRKLAEHLGVKNLFFNNYPWRFPSPPLNTP